MGVVYQAHDIHLEFAGPDRRRRFIEEARVASPETPQEPRQFREARMTQATPDGRGIGVFWRESAAGGDRGGSGFFDLQGNALPVMTGSDKFTRH